MHKGLPLPNCPNLKGTQILEMGWARGPEPNFQACSWRNGWSWAWTLKLGPINKWTGLGLSCENPEARPKQVLLNSLVWIFPNN